MTSKELTDAYATGQRDFSNTNLRYANLCSADLRGAILRGADLGSADLSSANLCGANLCNANLRNANLRNADLYSANLSSANLCGANLCNANLRNADLYSADLRGAILRGADLGSADLCGAKVDPREIAKRQIMPAAGDLHVWKRLADGVICSLIIPDGTPRVGGVIGRKCRARLAVVVDGKGVSAHDGETQYAPGLTVIADNWDPDPLVECSGGIHFFLTREEAEDY